MKRLALLLFFMAITGIQLTKAQRTEIHFWTLQECQGDTLEFIKKNYYYSEKYGQYGVRYISQSLKVLFEEAAKEGIKFKTYCVTRKRIVGGFQIVLFVEDINRLKKKVENNEQCFCVAVLAYFEGEKRQNIIKSKRLFRAYPIDEEFLDLVNHSLIEAHGDACDMPEEYELPSLSLSACSSTFPLRRGHSTSFL